MKKLMVALLLALNLVTANASECSDLETMAEAIMIARQAGEGEQEMKQWLSNVVKDELDLKLYHTMIEIAFKLPQEHNEAKRTNLIKAYGQEWFKYCMEN